MGQEAGSGEVEEVRVGWGGGGREGGEMQAPRPLICQTLALPVAQRRIRWAGVKGLPVISTFLYKV